MNWNRLKFAGPSLLLWLAAGLSAVAHPGHAWGDADARHLLTSPDHLALLALTGGVMMLAARLIQRRLPRRLLQGAGAAAVVVAAVVWGAGL